jgi:hypothetical protein
MTIHYQVERWNDIQPELEPFAVLHWQEIALDHNVVPLDMDWDKYKDLDDKEVLHVVTARNEEGIVGYHISIICGHLHYKSTLHALVDLYYLAPLFRTGRTGLKLFQFTENSLKALGVKKIVTGTKVHFNHGRLFEHMGYTNTEVIYTKLIKE